MGITAAVVEDGLARHGDLPFPSPGVLGHERVRTAGYP